MRQLCKYKKLSDTIPRLDIVHEYALLTIFCMKLLSMIKKSLQIDQYGVAGNRGK